MIFSNWIEENVSNLKRFSKNNNLVHKSFEIGILVKGIDGILEVIGGILLISLNPVRLNRLTILLTQHELSEDPKDIIANFMINFSSNFNINIQYFGVIYLISHGLVKLILVILLWKRKIWAYPITIISLVLFIIYQIYRYMIYHSMGLIILTIFDIVMIVLTVIEYKGIKNIFA